MRRIHAAIAALGIASAPMAARAHEGGIDARGGVKAISGDSLTISTSRGDERFALTPRTRFVAGEHPVPRARMRVGDRVVVHAKRGAPPEAVEVRGAAGQAGRGSGP